MGHSHLHGDEIERLGTELYQRQIRDQVETEENIGKICAIDVETGEYHVADDVLEAARQLQEKHPEAALWGERIGYNAMYALSGFAELHRIVPVPQQESRPCARRGSAKGLVLYMADDFDAPLDDFKEYME